MQISRPRSEISTGIFSEICLNREEWNNSCLCQGMAVANGLENTDFVIALFLSPVGPSLCGEFQHDYDEIYWKFSANIFNSVGRTEFIS